MSDDIVVNIFIYAVVAIISLVIYYHIIASAVKAQRRDKLQLMQLKVLMEIAKQHGVDSSVFEEIVDDFNKDLQDVASRMKASNQ